MIESERAKFVLAIITNENLQMSAALASPMAECQEWLKLMAEPTDALTTLMDAKRDAKIARDKE